MVNFPYCWGYHDRRIFHLTNVSMKERVKCNKMSQKPLENKCSLLTLWCSKEYCWYVTNVCRFNVVNQKKHRTSDLIEAKKRSKLVLARPKRFQILSSSCCLKFEQLQMRTFRFFLIK